MDAEDWNVRYAGSELVWGAGPNRFLVAEAAGLEPGRAIDLACGEGRNAIWLAERGWRATGVDFSGAAIAKARRLAAERGVEVEWEVADLFAYEPAARAYELVLLFYLQVTRGELGAVVARAAAAVAPGGTFLLVAHHARNLAEGWGGPGDPAVLYGPEDVVPALGGLEVERAEAVDRPVEIPEGERTAIDVLVRARRARPG